MAVLALIASCTGNGPAQGAAGGRRFRATRAAYGRSARVALSYDVTPDLASATGTDNVVEGARMCTG
ncbi:hypothetical protein GCM10009608_82230 [Pseudonocardia alaniniphila]